MKPIAFRAAGALLVAALADVACVMGQRPPPGAAPPPSPQDSVAVASPQPRPAVASLQPPARTNVAPPAYGAAPPAYSTPPAYGSAPPAYGPPPPAYGATEAQGPGFAQRPRDEDRMRVAQTVATASAQIDRLHRIQSSATGERRENVADALYALERRRARVLQDLRELDAEPAGRRAAIRSELAIDLADLQSSLSDSYALSPPPSQGMPSPAPMAPP
jgi:hypothetical protein